MGSDPAGLTPWRVMTIRPFDLLCRAIFSLLFSLRCEAPTPEAARPCRDPRARDIVSFSARRLTQRRRRLTERLCHGVRPAGSDPDRVSTPEVEVRPPNLAGM
jgi:hypothetical protein